MSEPKSDIFAEFTITASGCVNSESPDDCAPIEIQSDDNYENFGNPFLLHVEDEEDERKKEKKKKKKRHSTTSTKSLSPFPEISFIDEASDTGEDGLIIAEENEDVNTSDSDDSDVKLGAMGPDRTRRESKWSATILFVASDVQLMFNLAEFNPAEGYETAPGKKPESPQEPEVPDPPPSPSENPVEPHPEKEMDNPNCSLEMDIIPNNGLISHSNHVPNGTDPPRDERNSEKNSLISDKPLEERVGEDEEFSKDFNENDDVRLPHENWGKKADFLLAVIGYSVDLSNVWRFPYLAYKNGGGAFIIPYVTILVLGAIPVFLMELAMGQYTQEGPIRVWKLSPLCRGIGYASCLMAYIVAFYYNMVIAWSFYYLFSSLTGDLPWTSCAHAYNSQNCWELQWDTNKTYQNRTYDPKTSVSSAYEFFERGMLGIHHSNGLHDLGKVRWQIALCSLLTFTILYFSLFKSVKSAGKVVWFTATIPYLILTILLIRGCLLPGAVDGIKYFITPNMSRLGEVQVWIDAAVQIFFSIGAGFGTHIAYSSHNEFKNNCYRDCLITAAVNSFTSIFSGFVVFSYLGYMAVRQHKDIDLVAQEGPGLVFIVYPEAIATLPGSHAWAILFFFMLVTLGMDSAFGGLESPLTGLRDQFYTLIRHRWSRELLTFLIVTSAFLFSLPCTTNGGMYVFKMLDTFAAGTSIIFAVLCQVIAIAWIYGVDQFCQDIQQMTGTSPGLYWRICWKFLCPTFLMILVVSSFLHFKSLVYKGGSGVYVYPAYANVLGWMIALASMSLIPGYAIFKLMTLQGSLRERLAFAITPVKEHHIIKRTKFVKRFQKKHWFQF